MTSVKKVTKEVEQAIAENKQKKEQLKQRIKAAEKSIVAAKKEMEAAAAADNEQAFIAASDKVRFNESVIKANEVRLAELERVPKEIALSTIEKVRAAQAEIAKAAEDKAANAVYEIYMLAVKAQEDADALQKVLIGYIQETGSEEYTQPYSHNGELDKLLRTIESNRNRIEQFNITTKLYSHIS